MTDEPESHPAAVRYELKELCAACVTEEHAVIEMVELGILEPSGSDRTSWRFDTRAVLRLKRAQRLRRDLDINLAGIAVTLDLLDELERARQRVKTLETHLAHLIDND